MSREKWNSSNSIKMGRQLTSESDARVIVLDLSEVNAIEGGGLGMLMFLRHWAQNHCIRFKLFNPRIAVRARLESSNRAGTLDIVSLKELLDLMGRAEQGYPLAACLWTEHCESTSRDWSKGCGC